MVLSLVVLGFIFVIGLIIGSFLNVVILRTISEESIVFPGSKCPKCQNPLKWYHNIPLFSYLFLEGKCAYCKEQISWQYPFVEFLTGCVFVGLFLKFCNPFDALFGLSAMNDISFMQVFNYIFGLISTCLFIIIAGTDFLEMRVANVHLYSLIGVGLVYGIGLTILEPVSFLSSPIFYSMIAALIGFASMEIYRYIASIIAGQMAHGDGDAYIAAGIGAYIGALIAVSNSNGLLNLLQYMAIIIIGAAILAAIVGLPMFLKNIVKDKFAFGTLITLLVYSFALRYLGEWVNDNIWTLIICLIVFLALCIVFVREMIINIRNHTSDGIPCPFGPALVAAAFLVMLIMPL